MAAIPFALLVVLLPRFWADAVSTPASHNSSNSRQLERNPEDNHENPTDEQLSELYRPNYGEEPSDLNGLHQDLDHISETSQLDDDELKSLLNQLKEGTSTNSTMSRLSGSGTTPGGSQGCGESSAEDQPGCVATWDDVLCWPESPPGQLVTVRCFKEFNGVKYHGRNNASRYCHLNGSWEEKANYSACIKAYSEMPFNVDDNYRRSEHTSIIYLCGYSLSLVVLCCATWIFAVCKDLHCLRNTIHANLFITYILTDSLWITSLCIELFMSKSTMWSCVIVVFLHYCHVTTFFWMFVEGHYLYMLVVQTFSADKIRCRLYMSIGWGIPLVVMITWAVVKVRTTISTSPELLHGSHYNAMGFDNHTRGETMFAQCPWLIPSDWDWLYMAPAVVVLIFNIIFLIRIMWVLITKLRSTNSAETQQYKKATKALLVLLPLLGLTYILVFASPSGGLVAHVFAYLQPILISTQGLTVALIYCFFNSEVRASIKTHHRRWKMARQFGAPEDSLRHFHKNRRPSSATEMTFMTSADTALSSHTSTSYRIHRYSGASLDPPDTV